VGGVGCEDERELSVGVPPGSGEKRPKGAVEERRGRRSRTMTTYAMKSDQG
jgi:hypothetical protein